MLRSGFYVCPVCGNTVHSMGQSVISCHGIVLPPLEAEEAEEKHEIVLQKAEDEYFVSVDHEMTKEHYISFLAAVSSDRVQIVKLYPEGNAEARFKINGVRMLYFYCNRDGLFGKLTLGKTGDFAQEFEIGFRFGCSIQCIHFIDELADVHFMIRRIMFWFVFRVNLRLLFMGQNSFISD